MHHDTNLDWLMAECAKANFLHELVPLAIAELKKFDYGAEIVCGPISTGGRGNPEENLKVFAATIKRLQQQERPIFNQMPYEERIAFFTRRWREEDPSRAGEYYMPILEEFYYPIFQTLLIRRAWFIPGWQKSRGASWERGHFVHPEVRARTRIHDLTDEWIDKVLAGQPTYRLLPPQSSR